MLATSNFSGGLMKPLRLSDLLALCLAAALTDPLNAAESSPPIGQGPLHGALEKPAEPEKKRPAEGIQDNSFLVEEAYNQEAGVVQHIFNFVYTVDKQPRSDARSFVASFTQEWPLLSQDHQISYTIPFETTRQNGHSDNGIQDVAIHYRWQALKESDRLPAFAPRISFFLPTGDEKEDRGAGKVTYQANLPFSKVLSDRWTVHFNAGATVQPELKVRLDDDRLTPKRTFVNYNLGLSAIYAVTSNFNLMLESVATWDQRFDQRGRVRRDFSPVVSPGFRYAFNFPKVRESQLVLGLAAPIGLKKTAPDYGAFAYLSFEHSF